MNEMTTEARQKLGAQNCEALGERSKPPKFALATECHRAIDLSCRACDACGALALGAGLGFPVGHPQPPILFVLFCEVPRRCALYIFQHIELISSSVAMWK